MAPFIAKQVEKKAKISIEEGRNKYSAYFVKTSIWLDYKEDVDAILRVDGYEECIVER